MASELPPLQPALGIDSTRGCVESGLTDGAVESLPAELVSESGSSLSESTFWPVDVAAVVLAGRDVCVTDSSSEGCADVFAAELLVAVVVVGFTLVELTAVALKLVCAVPSLVDAVVELTSDVELAVGELLNSPSPHPACTKLKAQ